MTMTSPNPERRHDRPTAGTCEPEAVAANDRRAPAADANATRAPYSPPLLERLGEWSALTLQQSVGIGPGDV